MVKKQRFMVLGDDDVIIDAKYVKGWTKVEDGRTVKLVISYTTGSEKLTIVWKDLGWFGKFLVSMCLFKLAKLMDIHRI